MTDITTPQTRSRMMASIKGRNTAPELVVRRFLHAEGFRFRLHRRDLPGTPDIVLPRYHAAVFVHGCFWHRHEGCRYTTTPATHPEFWQQKFQANRARDQRDLSALVSEGWKVVIIWECATKHHRERNLLELARVLRGDLRCSDIFEIGEIQTEC